MNKVRMEHNASLTGYQNEYDRVKRKLSQMVDAIADGAPLAPITDKMHELDARRTELEEVLEHVEEAPPLLHPNMAHRYRDQVGRLIETLNVPEHRGEAVEVIRSLVEKVVLTPDESENRLMTDLHGDLAGILTLAAGRDGSAEITDAAIARHKNALGLESQAESGFSDSQEKLVAGAGFGLCALFFVEGLRPHTR